MLNVFRDMKYNIYGRKFEIVKDDGKWIVFILGSEGKKRVANDIFIPSSVSEENLVSYLEDLLHEWATPDNDDVSKLER
jgi:hypothetical protein